MMVIVGGRGNGKTAQLIKLSAETGIPIFAPTNRMARSIREQAKNMGIDIPPTESYCERSLAGHRRILIDEAQEILERHGIEVVCATFDASRVDLSRITLFELIGMWLRLRRGNGVEL